MAISIVGTSGVSGAAVNGGTITLTFAATSTSNDISLVMNVNTRTPATNVTSSNGTAYTTLASTSNGNLVLTIWYRVCASGETTVNCSNSGSAADGVCAAQFLLRGASPYTDINVSSAQTGTSSQPNSPAVLVNHANDMVFSCVASLANSAAAVTAPSGYGTLISTGATDTRSSQLGMSQVTSTNNSNSPLSYDPTAYSSFTSAVWIGYTVSVTSTDPYTPFDLISQPTRNPSPTTVRGVEVVSYW